MNPTSREALVNGAAAKADLWFTPGRFAVLLAVCIFAAYPDIVLGLRTFYFRDFGLYGYPLAHHFRESFWRGEVPLWNPLSNCGLPFLAQWNTLVLYPGSLFYLLFPLSWSLSMFCLGHLFLAGLGMHCLAYDWVRNRLAASVAGLAFVFNGMSLNSLMWPALIATLGWMPWTVLFVQHAWRRGGQMTLAAGVIGAFQMLTGTPEVILFTWIVVAAFAGLELVSSGPSRGTLIRRLALVALIVIGLSAAQLLPFFDLLRHSQRGTDFANADWSMPGTGWANLLVPLFRCYQSTHDVFFQSGQFWTSSYYLGMGTLALGVVACWQVRNWRVGLLAITTGLTLVLALGDQGFLYPWLRKIIPEMSFMRFPIKFVVLTSFCVPLLAAFAVGYRRHQVITHDWSGYAAYLIVAIILAVMVAIIIWFDYRFPLFPNMGYWPGTWRNGLSRILFLGAILGIVWLLQKPTNTRLKWLASGALLMSIFLDGLTHAPRQNPTVPRTAFDPGLVKLSPHPRLGESRAMISPSANRVLFQTTTSDTLNDYICKRLSLFSNCNLLDDIPKINGFYPLFLHRMDDVRVMVYDTSKEPLPPLYDFLGISQITAPGKFFEWESRTNYLAWATVGQKPSFVGEAAALHAIGNTNFNPRRAVYLPPEAKPFIRVTQTTRASIISSRFSAHRIEIAVEADQPSLLVVSQVYFPSWRAWVDAKATHLWPANYAFQALEIPQGKHRVTLVYRDRSFFLGTTISIATLVACVIVWCCRTPRTADK